MDTLWLACLIDDTHYAIEAYQWKRRILRLAGQIRTLATRAILAARKKENAEIAAEEKESTVLKELTDPVNEISSGAIGSSRVGGTEPLPEACGYCQRSLHGYSLPGVRKDTRPGLSCGSLARSI